MHSLTRPSSARATSSSAARLSLNCLSLLLLFGGGRLSSRSMMPSSVMALATSSPPSPSLECAVVGVGVLGTSLCRQLLEAPEFKDWKVTGITKSTGRHAEIMKQMGGDHAGRFALTTAEELKRDGAADASGGRFKSCVFCAPPSGFDDYAGAIGEAMAGIWAGPPGGGVFVFTSSGGIYGPGESTGPPGVVKEDTVLPDPDGNPRSERLAAAEGVVLPHGGACLRLAGLYNLDRGAHNFWLGKEEVPGRADGIVNLLHYDDAAGSVVAALSADPSVTAGKVFLISDGHPLTRQEICESTTQAAKYAGMKIPTFSGPPDGPIGKIYDGSASNQALKWGPRYPSFDSFMASQ